jgi:hypothetical protein
MLGLDIVSAPQVTERLPTIVKFALTGAILGVPLFIFTKMNKDQQAQKPRARMKPQPANENIAKFPADITVEDIMEKYKLTREQAEKVLNNAERMGLIEDEANEGKEE